MIDMAVNIAASILLGLIFLVAAGVLTLAFVLIAMLIGLVL